jgi:polyhydroxyalkanoate synthase
MGARLLRYSPAPESYSDPKAVFIIHGLVGRAEIWDLLPSGSFVEELTSAGTTVYLLDFGVPTTRDATNTLETYCLRLIPGAFRAVQQDWTTGHLFVVGYCFGGVLALLWAASKSPAGVTGLVLMATPVDFREIGSLVESIRPKQVDLQRLLDETGNVPPGIIRRSMRMLRPTENVVNYVNLLEKLWDDEYVKSYQIIGRWAKDALPFPGRTFIQCVDQLVRKNALLTGSALLGGKMVSLADIKIPTQVLIATRDHIVPPTASLPAMSLLGGPVELVEIHAGHVALLMGRSAKTQTVPHLTSWMSALVAGSHPE